MAAMAPALTRRLRPASVRCMSGVAPAGGSDDQPPPPPPSPTTTAVSGAGQSKRIFSFDGAGYRLRLVSLGTVAHTMFWLGHGAVSTLGPPEALGLDPASSAALVDMTSPVWTAAGVGMSAVFMAMSGIYARQVVYRATLDDAGRISVQGHTFFGSPGEMRPLDRGFSFTEGAAMVTVKEPSSTFHLMFDTGGTGASDKAAKGELLAALKSEPLPSNVKAELYASGKRYQGHREKMERKKKKRN